MNEVIQTAISALGYSENGKYHREMDCFDTVLDIIRYLRDDSSSMETRIECGRHNIIECDLIPLLKIEDLKTDEFDVTIRLLINLCQPAVASLKGKAPSDREEWKLYWDLEENLKRSKKAFSDPIFFRILKQKLEEYFFETDLLDEKLRLLMERIILLLKYIFSINTDRAENQNNSTDNVILAFIDSGLDKTLIRITNLPREREFHVSMLDIFALILKDHTADELAFSSDEELEEKRKKETDDYFKKMNEQYLAKESAKRRSFSRFGGSYVIKGMSSSASVRDQVVFKPIRDITTKTFNDERKAGKRVAKNRRPLEIVSSSGSGCHYSKPEVRQKLKQMVTELATLGFDRLIKSAKQVVFGLKAVLQRNSQINYFFLIKFILRFVRLAGLPLSCISQCTGLEAFHENNVQLIEYFDNATTLKSMDAKAFGLKAHYALGAYNELIKVHQYACKKGSSADRKMAEETLSRVMKIEEYRDLAITLFKKFNPVSLPNNFLHDVIIGCHNYVQILEKFSKSGKMNHVTKKTKIKKPRKAKKPLVDEDNRAQFDKLGLEQVEEFWERMTEKIEKVVSGEVEMIEDMNPLNTNVDVEDTMQQQFAMLSIQRSLRAKCFPAAVGLYRAGRKIWMVDGVFGRDGMTTEEELEELKQICIADLKEVAVKLREAEEEAAKKLESSSTEGIGENELESDEEGEEDEVEEPCWKVEQIEFNFDEYIGRFAKVEVLRWYVYALEDFKKNSDELNKAIIRMMHRVAFDLKLFARLYQISLFNIFEKVNEQVEHLAVAKRKESQFYQIYEFGHYLLKKYFEKYNDFGVNLAVETLFWKGAREAYEIDNGYGSWDIEKQADSRVWTEELELEVRNLYDEYMAIEEEERNVHVIDFIENNMTRKRTKKQVYRKMCEMGLRVGVVPIELDPKASSLPAGEIRKIYDEWNSLEREEKDQKDVVEMIRDRLADDHGDVPRRRIIKMMNYLSIGYEKPKKERKEKALPKWDEGLVKKLEGLKEQYEEIDDAENILGVDIVKYVIKRLSEKKPVRQIERYLISMGAKVAERPKKERVKKVEKEKKGKDEFLNDGSGEDEGEMSESEEEEDEENEDEESTTKKKDKKEKHLKKKEKVVIESDDDEPLVENYVDENADENEPPKKKAKKKVLIESDDEDDEKVVESRKPDEPPVLEVKKISLLEKIRNRKRKFAQLLYSDDDSSSSDNEKEDEGGEKTESMVERISTYEVNNPRFGASDSVEEVGNRRKIDTVMERMMNEEQEELSRFKRGFYDDMSLVGSVAAGGLPSRPGSPESDPFTKAITFKKRKMMVESDED